MYKSVQPIALHFVYKVKSNERSDYDDLTGTFATKGGAIHRWL